MNIKKYLIKLKKREWNKNYREHNPDYYKKYEESVKKWRKNNPSHILKYYKKEKQKGGARAKWKIKNEVKRGRLPSLIKNYILCVDCKIKRARNYDHRDYNKPLEVSPVCVRCNCRRGPAIPLRNNNP